MVFVSETNQFMDMDTNSKNYLTFVETLMSYTFETLSLKLH